MTEEIIDICQSRSWWKDVVGGVIDYAAFQRPLNQAGTVHDIWLARAGIYLAANRVPIADGIERLNSFLKQNPVNGKPKIVWSIDCQGILSEFGAEPNPITKELMPYRWKSDRNGRTVGDTPEDKNNHAVKATAYYLIHKYGYTTIQQRKKIKVNRH